MNMHLLVRDQYGLDEATRVIDALVDALPETSPFLQSFWLRPWLEQNQDMQPIWLQCCVGDTAVASLFVVLPSTRNLTSLWRIGWFNKTGNTQRDQIWIEFNGLLALPEWHDEAVRAILDWCHGKAREWRLEITASPTAWASHRRFLCERSTIPSYAVNMTAEFSDRDYYLSTLSSNTRSRIRRAIKYLETHYGSIRIISYQHTPPDAVMQALSQLHKERWQHTEQGSGYNNPDFVAFHNQLMQRSTEHSRCDILAFYAGEQCIGITYNLLSKDKVYFYLSGVDYLESSNRFQPGLVIHTFAISYYASQGFTRYDFMGGDSQYKRSLANQQYNLYLVKLLKKDWLTAVYFVLKRFKRQIFDNRRK